MTRRSDDSLATLLLTSRLVDSEVPVLKASEYWKLVDYIEIGSLLGRDERELIVDLGDDMGTKVATLLDRAAALAFAVEELEQQGIRAIAATDGAYPSRYREHLGAAAPAHLHIAGPPELAQRRSIGIVGSRDLAPKAAELAKDAARLAAEHDYVVISGGARGTDSLAMNAALEADGEVVGVLADSLVRTAKSADVRRAVVDEKLCLATPYAPTAPFSAGNAMGRNKMIYALTDVTFVVASDDGKGGTWAGAKEAIRKHYSKVAVWRGEGEGPGNEPLEKLGGIAIADLAELVATKHSTPSPAQLSLDV